MMPPSFAYLYGTVVMMLIWLVLYFWRKDLRREMVWGGLLLTPLAVTHPFWIPEYWVPVTVFGLTNVYGVGIEDFLWSFSFGGVATVLYEIVFSRKEKKISHHKKRHIWAYVIAVLSYLVLEVITPETTIWNTLFSLALLSCIIFLQRRDLRTQMLLSAIFMSIFYILTYQIIFISYPNFAEMFTRENLINLSLLGIPIEEVILSFLFGIAWSGLYEYVNGYKTVAFKSEV